MNSRKALSRQAIIAIGASAAMLLMAAVPVAAHTFANGSGAGPNGLGPLGQIGAAADRHGNRPSCNLTPNKLKALMLPPTWAEVAGRDSTLTPHPMTLGRADYGSLRTDNRSLYFENNPAAANRVFWHPGVGMWQVDDAGMGVNLASGKWRPYDTIATEFANRWCSSGGNPAAVYGPFFGCQNRGRWRVAKFNELYNPANDTVATINQNNLVDYWAGMKPRTCRIGRQRFSCVYVDPGQADPDAQRSTWLYNPYQGGANGGAPSPLALPFYVYTLQDGKGVQYEYRIWLDADLPDKPYDVTAVRRFGRGSRGGGLTWIRSSNLCDETARRGHC